MTDRAGYFSHLSCALLVCAITPFASAAWAATCAFPEARTVQVSVNKLDGAVVHNNTRSRDGLRRMQRQSGRSNAFGSAWTPVGLTLTELKYQMRLKIEAIPVNNSTYCARVTEVNADLGYDTLKVYIARKFKPGSCAYRSISAHEMTHVAVFRQALDQFFHRLQHRLQRAAQGLDSVTSRSPDRAAAYLRKRLSATIKPLFLEMNRELDRNNAKLDTPERYRREQALCSDW